MKEEEKVKFKYLVAGIGACILVLVIINNVLESRKNERLKQEYTTLLEESMAKVYEDPEGRRDGVTDISFEVTDLEKVNSSTYLATVVVDCTCRNTGMLDYTVMDYVPGGRDGEMIASTGDKITTINRDYKSEYYMESMVTVNINGRRSLGPDPRPTSNSKKKSDDRIKKCPVCERTFNMGTDDSWSITINGMCEQCYKNYNTAQEMLGH